MDFYDDFSQKWGFCGSSPMSIGFLINCGIIYAENYEKGSLIVNTNVKKSLWSRFLLFELFQLS